MQITKEIQPGEIYTGMVKRIESFGAFVEILPGRDGMVHVSDMSLDYVKNPSDIVKIGDSVQVRVKEIDDLGRINLSMLLEGDVEKRRPMGPDRQRGRDRDQGRRFDRGRGRDRNQGRDKRSSGPHFPASRLVDTKKKDY